MSSFEFHGPEKFASCQYHAEDFFAALDDVRKDYPLLSRARRSFEKLHDDTFNFANGEAGYLESEVNTMVEELQIDLADPPKKHALLAVIFQEMKAVFDESRSKATDIHFRWG
ncbi:MAG: hypothetical protein ACTSUY_10495 [Alphaproteobacteria bacterium]